MAYLEVCVDSQVQARLQFHMLDLGESHIQRQHKGRELGPRVRGVTIILCQGARPRVDLPASLDVDRGGSCDRVEPAKLRQVPSM
jgi:hypothetical protein